MKIIITGATGSLGAYLTRWFALKGHDVMAVGRVKEPPPRLYAYAGYIRADINNPYKLPQADLCIHTAAIADDKAAVADLYKTNVLGTEHTARAAADCRIFIQISSSSVYPHATLPLSEGMTGDGAGEKLSHYGRSKLSAEQSLINNYKNESCFILRPRGIYGAGDKVLLPRLLKLVKNNMMIRAGDMNVKLSMTHFSNLAMAIDSCIHSGKKGLHIYNVADEEVYVLYESVKKLLDAIHARNLPEKRVPLWILKWMSAFNMGEATPLFIDTISKNLVLDISKIKRELNYAPTFNFNKGVIEIAEWVKAMGGVDVVKTADPALAWK